AIWVPYRSVCGLDGQRLGPYGVVFLPVTTVWPCGRDFVDPQVFSRTEGYGSSNRNEKGFAILWRRAADSYGGGAAENARVGVHERRPAGVLQGTAPGDEAAVARERRCDFGAPARKRRGARSCRPGDHRGGACAGAAHP